MTKLVLAVLISAIAFSTFANAKTKIEPIRVVPKQDRGIASEDDSFVPLMTPDKKKQKQKRKPLRVTKESR